jgi:hypothetical protein
VEPELMEECADWIAAQLEEEEAMWVDASLVQMMLESEWAEDERIPAISHEEAADRILRRLEAAGVQGVPDAIDRRLVLGVLQWEDDFLAFAGRTRMR